MICNSLFFIVLQEKRQQSKKFLKKVDLSFIIKNKSVSLHFISSLSNQRDFRYFEVGWKKLSTKTASL